MENMTGLNPSIARSNIIGFNNRVQNACNSLNKVFNILFNELSNNWYSSRAVDFYDKFSASIVNLGSEIKDEVTRINNNACNAYNMVARTNGVSTISINNNIVIDTNYPKLLNISRNGVVGMRIENVRNILNEFIENIRSVIREFDTLPTSIALYDDNNGIKRNYSVSITKLENKVEDFIDIIVNEIQNNIENEMDIINSNKNTVINTLNE